MEDMAQYDNRADYYEECEFNVVRLQSYSFKKYLARICGPDEKFGLRRDFLRYISRHVSHKYVFYNYGELPDGVYETCVKYYSSGNSGALFRSIKKYMVLYHKKSWNFTSQELSTNDILRFVKSIDNHCFL